MSYLFFKATGFASSRNLPQLSGVEPLIPNIENQSYGHWLFGHDASSLIDVVNGRALTLQGGATTQPTYAATSVTIPTTVGNALLSDLIDVSDQSMTLCAVVKCASTALSVLLGNLVTFDTTTSSGLSAFSSANKVYLTVKPTTATNVGGIASLTPAVTITQTSNFFIAASVNKSTKKGIIYVQQAGVESNNEAIYTSGSYQASTNKIGIGNVAYNGGLGVATYNEAIIFDKALTLDEIKAVAARSKERLSNRNVSF